MKIAIIWRGMKLKEIKEEQIVSEEKTAKYIIDIINALGESLFHNRFIPILNRKPIQSIDQLYREIIRNIKAKRNCIITLVEPEKFIQKQETTIETIFSVHNPVIVRIAQRI